MKILNLYAGIGGNRKLWGGDIEVTAVELNPDIAKIYQDFFPDDKVIVGDAHQYLLDHFQEYDFIWSSPPCPTHSRMNHLLSVKGNKIKYPDMGLYQEIILLETFFKGFYCVENVMTYYDPLIQPKISGRHYLWSNFYIGNMDIQKKVRNDKGMTLNKKMKEMNIHIKNFYNYDGDKRTLINNCIEPELGLYIFNSMLGIKTKLDTEQYSLF